MLNYYLINVWTNLKLDQVSPRLTESNDHDENMWHDLRFVIYLLLLFFVCVFIVNLKFS